MANVPINNITDTWNSSGTNFTGIKFNVTDTASAATSTLLNLQITGSSKFAVRKNGAIYAYNSYTSDTSYSGVVIDPTGSIGYYRSGEGAFNVFNIDSASAYGILFQGTNSVTTGGFKATSGSTYSWTSGVYLNAVDLVLARDAANTLAQRNGANAQEFRVYNSYNGTNNDFAKIRWNSNVLEIGHAAGTGSFASTARKVSIHSVGAEVASFGFGTTVGTPSTDQNHAWVRIAGTYNSYISANATLHLDSGVGAVNLLGSYWRLSRNSITSEGLWTQYNPTQRDLVIGFSVPDYADCPTRNWVIKAGNPKADNITNITGGDIRIEGGGGASASTGNAHGGNIYLRGGTKYGTGHVGYIIMDNLPTSNPAVAGALWNDAGTLKVSAG